MGTSVYLDVVQQGLAQVQDSSSWQSIVAAQVLMIVQREGVFADLSPERFGRGEPVGLVARREQVSSGEGAVVPSVKVDRVGFCGSAAARDSLILYTEPVGVDGLGFSIYPASLHDDSHEDVVDTKVTSLRTGSLQVVTESFSFDTFVNIPDDVDSETLITDDNKNTPEPVSLVVFSVSLSLEDGFDVWGYSLQDIQKQEVVKQPSFVLFTYSEPVGEDGYGFSVFTQDQQLEDNYLEGLSVPDSATPLGDTVFSTPQKQENGFDYYAPALRQSSQGEGTAQVSTMSVEARRAKMAQRLRPFGQAQEGTASEYVSDWEDTFASESKNTREGVEEDTVSEDVSSLSEQDLLERQRKDYESVEKAIGFLGKAVTSLGKKI